MVMVRTMARAKPKVMDKALGMSVVMVMAMVIFRVRVWLG
jgi:hypothetical protein